MNTLGIAFCLECDWWAFIFPTPISFSEKEPFFPVCLRTPKEGLVTQLFGIGSRGSILWKTNLLFLRQHGQTPFLFCVRAQTRAVLKHCHNQCMLSRPLWICKFFVGITIMCPMVSNGNCDASSWALGVMWMASPSSSKRLTWPGKEQRWRPCRLTRSWCVCTDWQVL